MALTKPRVPRLVRPRSATDVADGGIGRHAIEEEQLEGAQTERVERLQARHAPAARTRTRPSTASSDRRRLIDADDELVRQAAVALLEIVELGQRAAGIVEAGAAWSLRRAR